MIIIRKAKITDVKQMHKLLNHFSFQERKELLPRSMAEIYENLQNYFVGVTSSGHVIGTCALYVIWDNLAEIKALCVVPAFQNKGLGKKLLKACLDQAKALGITQLFALTQKTGFFEKYGFESASKDQLPNKVWTECIRCPYFPEGCIEVAMVREVGGRRRKAVRMIEDVPAGFMVPAEPDIPGVAAARGPRSRLKTIVRSRSKKMFGSLLPSEPPRRK